MENLFRSFRATVRRHSFIKPSDSVLVGVSGGVDSMVLSALCARLKKDFDFELALAHVNYGLRGRESDAQEKWVRDFAAQHGLPCHVTRACLPETSPQNFQAMARDFRYHYFLEVALKTGALKVAVAHHLEDQAETILAHLLRGTSLKGLAGMLPQRELGSTVHGPRSVVQLIRPLLKFSKEQLKAYAAQNNIPFIEDSSNTSDQYWRNRLRYELLPVVKKMRAQSLGKIVQLGEEMRELSDFLSIQAKDWLKAFAKQEEKSFWLPRPRLVLLPKTLRQEILKQTVLSLLGPNTNLKRDHFTRCEQIFSGPKTEALYCLPHELRFRRRGDDLFIENKKGCDNL